MRARQAHTPTGVPAIGRRGLLTAGLAAAGLGLAGCGPSPQGGQGRTRLRQWNLFTGGDGARLQEMHAVFRDEHPGIDLEDTTFLWGDPFYTKLTMGAAGGRAFDVATVHLSRLRSLGAGTLLNPVPRDLLAEFGVTEDTVPANVWDKCLVDGELYAIPLDTHLVVTYYNREICERAGVLDEHGSLIATSGEDELFDLLAQVKEVTGRYGIVTETTGGWRVFWSLYRQLGGEMTFDGELGIDDDKALRCLDFLRRICDEELAPRSSDAPGTPANFQNEVAGVMFGGNWELPTFADVGMDFGMQPFPAVFGDDRLGQGDSHAFVLPYRRDPDEETERAAVEYAAWMLRNSIIWADGGHTPAYHPVVESEEYQGMEPQVEYRDAAENVLFDPDVWFSGSAAKLQNDANSVFQAVFTGATTPEVALDRFKSAAQRLIDTPPPV